MALYRCMLRLGVTAAFMALLLPGGSRTEPSADASQPANRLEGQANSIEEGRSLFNQYCAHCHGPNAIQGERPRDLRRLRIRYRDEAAKVFYETVNAGRPDLGMPPWKGVLADDVLARIFAYLQTVQTHP